MQISNVTKEDVVHCVQLVKALNTAKFANLSAADIGALQQTLRWISSFGQHLGKVFETEQNKDKSPISAAQAQVAHHAKVKPSGKTAKSSGNNSKARSYGSINGEN